MSINKPGSRRNGLRGDAHSAVSGHSKLLYFALALLLSAQYWSYQHCQVQFGTSLLESFTANANSFTHLIGIDAAGGASSSSSSSEAPPMFLKKHYDVCIAGAGLSGAVLAERYATQMGKTVLVVEKRDHIGGNCYDYIDVRLLCMYLFYVFCFVLLYM